MAILVCWWLGLYFCFVCCFDEVSCTGCYWWLVMPGLVLKWFPLCKFSLFDTPYGYFSGSLGSWSQSSHSKAQGLMSVQEWRFHKWPIMALSDIKTNTKKMINQRSTPDKWQLQNQANNNQINGIYTYTPISKIKTIQLKYSRLTQHTKEIKKL